MRKDMYKVIVERPRVGGSPVKGWMKNIPMEELPLRESMKRRHSHGWDNAKELNENLAPLKRYLISKVGQKWDDIYSDICKNLRLDSAVQKHVRDHLKQMIEINTFIGTDGKVWFNSSSGDMPISSKGWVEFYVHPTTGILFRQQWKKHWWRSNAKGLKPVEMNIKTINDTLQCHRIEGIWYELHLVKLPKLVVHSHKTLNGVHITSSWDGLYDIFLRSYIRALGTLVNSYRTAEGVLRDTYGRSGVYCVKKVQCSKKSIKSYKLAS